MKKIIFIVSAVIIACLSALGGCSCTPTNPLSFNNDFNGGGGNSENNLSTNYLEVLTYDVVYDDNYNAYLAVEGTVETNLIPTYSSGSYVTKFYGDGNSLPSGITSDIDYDGDFHRLQSEFNITVSANGTDYNDQILTDVYFYSSGHSFAPVYSRVILRNSFVVINSIEDTVTITPRIYEYITVYNKTSYVISKNYYDGADAKDLDLTTDLSAILQKYEEDKTYSYNIKQIIDNTQLLFAIRNLGIQKEGQATLPTVSPTYGESKTLIIKNKSEATKTLNLTFNGTPLTNEEIPVKNMSYVMSGTSNVGTEQFVVLQKGATTNLKYRALPIEYAETLIEYGGLRSIGALKYTLKSIEFAE